MKQHTKEAVALVLYFILITIFVLAVQPNKVLGHFLYFIVPSLFLVARRPAIPRRPQSSGRLFLVQI